MFCCMSAVAVLCFLGYCTDVKPSVQEDDKTKCANRRSLPVVLQFRART